MHIDKDLIIDLLHQRGRHDTAEQAKPGVPDKVDHEQHANLLSKFGINPAELLGKLPGGGDKLPDDLGTLLGRK